MAEHNTIKPEKLVATAVGTLEQELVIPNLFQKEGIDKFKGADNDTVHIPVEGILPFHDYEWRNSRNRPLEFDEYAERKIAVSFGGNVYSAVQLTDEQLDMNDVGWGKLMGKQARAIARGLQRRAVSKLTGQTYNVTIGNCAVNLRGALIEARRVLNAFNVPEESRYVLIGTDFEAALLSEEKLNLAQNVGTARAESALAQASIGNLYGFRFVVSKEIGATDAYAFAGSAFIALTGAPSVPQSVPYGATTSFEGFGLRWMRDYDSLYLRDRSILNTYAGFQSVADVLVGWDSVAEKEVISTSEHFVRGIKLTLDGASDYPAASGELATITGVSDAAVWTPTGRAAENAAANA